MGGIANVGIDDGKTLDLCRIIHDEFYYGRTRDTDMTTKYSEIEP